ncbi:hypothetical protein CDCA_CDCA01G0026 [Cyanidium caldarium]|uniref:Uncharacterized protein n=1 Tax=Cyanidium caldarium TaxID=2771 RepID=A0AAV9IPK4_CYACA|nr:hypothetical protein CDCA_CDCA01G0026 [Cyanidium caldarium]
MAGRWLCYLLRRQRVLVRASAPSPAVARPWEFSPQHLSRHLRHVGGLGGPGRVAQSPALSCITSTWAFSTSTARSRGDPAAAANPVEGTARPSATATAPANAYLALVDKLLGQPWATEAEENLQVLQPDLDRAHALLDEARRAAANGSGKSPWSPSEQHDLHLLFLTREMVLASNLLTEHALDLLRHKMGVTGVLGNKVAPTDPELQSQCEQVIVVYEKMLRRLQQAREEAVRDVPDRAAVWHRALDKFADELGIHVLQLRQMVDIPDFSERFGVFTAGFQLLPRPPSPAK